VASDSLPAGQSNDRYQVVATLGHGGMADVYLARMMGPAGFSKLAVLKRLREDREHDDDHGFRAMFLDEARLAARLNHANIVQTFETGEDEQGVFMAMEYLEGQPLSLWLRRLRKRGERLPVEVCLYVLTSVLEALEYAHSLTDYDGARLGLVHRDVSPQNIFITYQGSVKLVDFGVAKAVNASQKTQVGVIKGKVAYMSREQAQGAADLDGRADVFSAAIVLWEALTGKRMWAKLGDLEILTNLIQGTPIERPSDSVPEVPRQLEDVLMKALAMNPEDRYQSAQAFLEALEGARNELGLRISAREVGLFVAKEFAIEREKVREALVLAGRGGPPPSESNLAAVTHRETESRSGASSRSRRFGAPVSERGARSTSGTRRVADVDARADEAPKSNTKWIVAVSSAAALSLAAIYFSTRTAPDPVKTPVSIQAPTTSAATIVSAPSIVRSEAGETSLEISVTPLNARLFLDDRPLGSNPFQGKLARNGANHILRAEAPGYRTREMQITLDKDRSIDFALQSVGVAPPWPPPARAAVTGTATSKLPAAGAPPPTARTFEELTPNQKDDRKLQLDTDAFKKK
jgi:eukaryotic-like serine/threonine-protein kinase